jgi:hypothetical protein
MRRNSFRVDALDTEALQRELSKPVPTVQSKSVRKMGEQEQKLNDAVYSAIDDPFAWIGEIRNEESWKEYQTRAVMKVIRQRRKIMKGTGE